MKLEFFKPNQPAPRGVPMFSVKKSGLCSFNAAACREFPFLQKNSRIAFCNDEEKPGCIYMINQQEDGITLNRYLKTGKHEVVQFQSKDFSIQVKTWLRGQTDKPLRFRIAAEPTEFNGKMYHGLILQK